VQQALKKEIISVFEPIYLDILNDNMVGFSNISDGDMLDHLFGTCRCAEHGIPDNLLNPCSSRFKIVPITLRQGGSLLDTHGKSTLDTPKYLQLGTS
jgi:hypothetical protein